MAENKKAEILVNSDFETQMKIERDFYLGKLKDDDKVPGSDLTIKEAREQYALRVSEYENERNASRQLLVDKALPVTATTTIIPGVVVEMEMPKAVVVPDVKEVASNQQQTSSNSVTVSIIPKPNTLPQSTDLPTTDATANS